MIYLIVGHRGVGKTLWLKKLQKWFTNSLPDNKNNQYLFLDLDQEIEKKGHMVACKTLDPKLPCPVPTNGHKVVGSFFDNQKSQKVFRRLEHTVLTALINKYKSKKTVVFIALGAGFDWKSFKFPQPKPQTKSQKKGVTSSRHQELCHIIHLIRETSALGRVFLDRPRLDKNKSPYEEYMSLYPQRENSYQQIKTESFVLPEHDFNLFSAETLFFTHLLSNKDKKRQAKPLYCSCPLGNFVVTLNKQSLPARMDQWPAFIQKRLKWDGCFFELRDDQLNNKELEYLLSIIPNYRILLAFRSVKNQIFNQRIVQNQKVPSVKKKNIEKKNSSASSMDRSVGAGTVGKYDWPLEQGMPCPLFAFPPVLSLHARKKEESFKSLCQKLVKHKAGHFKLAVPVKNFSELMEGHLWFLKDPQNRSFLPVSELLSEPISESMPEPPKKAGQKSTGQRPMPGRWRWYRQIFGPYMKLNFIREGPSKVADQPFLYEYLISLKMALPKPLFSAVLGDPVAFSASPAFHRAFFEKQGMVFVKIPMKEEEMTKKNLNILQKMGMGFSAVTSPLKKKAFKMCDITDSPARSLKSVNTLIWKKGECFGGNTDHHGFKNFFEEAKVKHALRPESMVVWGGGGVLPLLKKELPHAEFYSARTGKKHIQVQTNIRTNQKNLSKRDRQKTGIDPDTVIWAVGRSRMPFCQFPPRSWHPKWVLDLNYTEDSPGKEYALLCQAKYISGKTMFEYQARRQQSLFSRLTKSSQGESQHGCY